MPMIAAVVNPIVATIEISITSLLTIDRTMKNQSQGPASGWLDRDDGVALAPCGSIFSKTPYMRAPATTR
jgi:hypothetical protein